MNKIKQKKSKIKKFGSSWPSAPSLGVESWHQQPRRTKFFTGTQVQVSLKKLAI
jgi:hypothetical protein